LQDVTITGLNNYLGMMMKGGKYSVIKEWILSIAATRGEVGYTLRIGTDKGNNYAFVLSLT
jgi:hypothetical protein